MVRGGSEKLHHARVTIGKQCIIRAASAVTHDMPEYLIAMGASDRVVKNEILKKETRKSVKRYTLSLER